MIRSSSPKGQEDELLKMMSSLSMALRREETPGEVSEDEFMGDLDVNLIVEDEHDMGNFIPCGIRNHVQQLGQPLSEGMGF